MKIALCERMSKRPLTDVTNAIDDNHNRKKRQRRHHAQDVDMKENDMEIDSDNEKVVCLKADRIESDKHGKRITLGWDEFKNIIQRVRIASLSQDANKKQKTIMDIVHCAKGTVRDWKNVSFGDPIDFVDEPRPGRKPIKRELFTQDILDHCYDRNFSRRKYSNIHFTDDVNISKSYASEICIKNDKYAYKNKRVGKYSNEHVEARFKWAKENVNRPKEYWVRHLVTDSKMWRLGGGMNRQNQRTTCDKGDLEAIREYHEPKHSPTIHTYGGLSAMGLTELVAITGTVTAKRYTKESCKSHAEKRYLSKQK